VLGVALFDDGQPGRAAAVLAGSDGDQLALLPSTWRAYFLELMTRYWLALGNRAEAGRTAEAAQSCASSVGLRLATAMADRAAAAVALSDRDPHAAAQRALAAAALADEVHTPIEAGLARTLAGRALAQLDDRDGAVALLETAAAELGRCGATRYRDAAELELRRLGQHIHRRSRSGDRSRTGIGSLTERELQIATLIAERKTNREIAGELFLSNKTIETHIRNVFRKLDVSSRVDIARTVERR